MKLWPSIVCERHGHSWPCPMCESLAKAAAPVPRVAAPEPPPQCGALISGTVPPIRCNAERPCPRHTEPPPTPAPPLSAPKVPDALCIPVLDDDGAKAFAVVKMTRDGRTVSDMVYAGNRHTCPLLLTDIEKIGGTEDWFREARAYLVSLGTTPPVRSVPSDQCGNLALNFCSPIPPSYWRENRCRPDEQWLACSVLTWHPCSFATLTI